MGVNKKHLYIKEVLLLYKNGTPKNKIATKFGVTEKTVAKWINDSKVIDNSIEARLLRIESDIKNIKLKLKNNE